MSWTTTPAAIPIVTECVESLGIREFYQPLLRLIEECLGAQQCMIFALDLQSRMSCLLSTNFSQESLATPLAKSYVQAGYRSDPNLQILTGLAEGKTQTLHLGEMIKAMPAGYREEFFSNPGLGDKVSILRCEKTTRYYINFYRGSGKRTFLEDGLFSDDCEGRLISSLVARHYELNDSLRADGPLAFLSDRERQVCQGILKGKKIEAIAADLSLAASTVITYRKRAYQKLGIGSRAALFALCDR